MTHASIPTLAPLLATLTLIVLVPHSGSPRALAVGDDESGPEATGACCGNNASCRMRTEQSCLDRHGEYRGDGTDCGGCNFPCVQCSPYMGTCCHDGLCKSQSSTQAWCRWLGELQSATTVNWHASNPVCPQGVCVGPCFVPDGRCEDGETKYSCEQQGGRFAREFEECFNYGPCYADGLPCIELTEWECDLMPANDIVWGGPNKTCAQSGACVLPDERCFERTESTCFAMDDDAEFYAGEHCPDVGPCLNTDGSCEVKPSSHCTGGAVPGDHTCECVDIACICEDDGGASPQCIEDPQGACQIWSEHSDEWQCATLKRSACEGLGLFCGANTNCDEPCDAEYPCCWRDLGVVSCEEMNAADCWAIGGSIRPLVTTCGADEPCLFGAKPCDDYALWTGGGNDTSIMNPDNWDSGEAPTATTPMAFELGGNLAVTIPQDTSVANTLVAQGELAFRFSGNTLNVSDSNSLCDDLIIGALSGLAALDVTDATIAGPDQVSLGIAPGATGVLTVGAGGALIMDPGGTAQVTVGTVGGSTGLLTIERGGRMNAFGSNGCAVGYDPGSSGALIVSNPNSFMDAGLLLVIGNGGYGTFDLSDSARVDVGALASGNMPGSSGDIMIDRQATLNVTQGTVTIGQYGTSTMTVDGANITDSNQVSTRPHTIGEQPGGIGTVILRGGTSWDLSTDVMAIGYRGSGALKLFGQSTFSCLALGLAGSGHGALVIREGSSVKCDWFGNVGEDPGSEGDIIIEGAQSKLELVQVNPNVWLAIGLQGAGHISVTNGGLLIWKNGVSLGRKQGGEGTLMVNGGTAFFDADLLFGGPPANAGQASATITNGGYMNVAGALHIRAMYYPGVPDNGLLVDGPSTRPGSLTTEELHVGRSSIARVFDGAQMNTNALAVLGGDVGSYFEPARVVIDGNGSTWNVGTVLLGELPLGVPGEVTVRNDGTINAVLIYVGPEGTLTVATGGLVDTAFLNVANGGTITTSTGIVVGGVPLPRRSGVTEGITTQQLNVEQGATLNVPSIALMPLGTIGGGGNVAVDIVNEGEISPGDDGAVLATLTVTGTYQQTATGVLRIDLGADGASDTLAVTGTASLGGTLIIERGQCATVLAGEPHVVFTASGEPGEFDQVIAPDHTDVIVEYIGGEVIVSLTQSVYFADSDGDGVIGLSDYAAFKTCLDEPGDGLGAGCECFDFDHDGDNVLRDFASLQTIFGH